MKEFRMLKTLTPQGIEPNGGGALSSDYVSKLGSKEVSKICHLERSERSKSNEILRLTPQNDNTRHPELVSGSHNETVFSRFTSHFSRKRVAFTLAEGATHVDTCDGKRKIAFTLAEVLITLGIIGVVASLTLPSVIERHQKLETVVSLKGVYSTLNQAYQNAIAENGEPENWLLVGEVPVEEYFNTYFKPYVKILKMCDTYKDCGYKTTTPWVYLDGSQSETAVGKFDNWVTAVLPNGTVILYMSFLNANQFDTTHTIVDLNGAKGPNRFGRDVFRFDRVKNIGFVPSGYNSTNIDCKKTTSGAGCAAKIMKDGWKISDDYPW